MPIFYVFCNSLGQLLKSFILPPNLNGQSYSSFLRNTFDDIMYNFALVIRGRMWFIQDGAPLHFILAVRNHLDATFSHIWTGRGSGFALLPRSPELNYYV